MPIYEYRCSSCGVQKEFLRKISDPALTTCPECGKETFSKMLTAAGFQLKGSGWYVTDFRNSGAAHAEKKDGEKTADKGGDKAGGDKAADTSGDASSGAKADKPDSGKAEAKKTETKSSESSATASTTSSTPAPTPSTTSGS